MTPTVYAVLITGHGARRLSLHTRRDRAEAEVVKVGRELWAERFGYELPPLDAEQVTEHLLDEGWQVTVDEVEVELP